jgi:hypothetical protein
MPAPKYRKRRPNQGPNKNELKVSRHESQEAQKTRAGILRERYPNVRGLQLGLRMETDTGAILVEASRAIGPDDTLWLDLPCEGGCGNGLFLLTEAVDNLLQAGVERKEGMGLCQAASYKDPKLPCGTKLFYNVVVDY